ncbi:MAG: hypothetical protein BWY94_01086 [Actinobacteria bacterium ADurb.BinA094]|nr:MAG: hypothetical protein BWY94_01086 [Actinobacteria bacterium ADurb.BinA094]
MPTERGCEPRTVAFVDADVPGAGAADRETLQRALDRVNRVFLPALAAPFTLVDGARLGGALRDPAQTPLCLSVLRESVAPLEVRAGVGIGGAGNGDPGDGEARSLARRALRLAVRDKGLTRYLGTGDAGDVLLGALCRLVDPLIQARTGKQWEAIAAYRELGRQRAVAERLGVTRQSVGDRLTAGNRRAVEEADAAVAAFLSLRGRPQPGA